MKKPAILAQNATKLKEHIRQAEVILAKLKLKTMGDQLLAAYSCRILESTKSLSNLLVNGNLSGIYPILRTGGVG